MSRKCSHIALIILLLMGSTGFIVNSHFCEGILKSLAINHLSGECCDSDQMPEGCCHDEAEEFAVDEYQVPKTDFSFNYPAVVLFTIQYFVSSDTYSLSALKPQLYSSKTSPPGSKIFVKIQSFLI